MFSSQLILVLLFKFGKRMSFAALIIIAAAVICSAQSSMDYSLQGQAPSCTNADPFPGGFVNVSNGNVHLEIPLGNYPQRGGSALQAAVTYDSRIWMPFNNGSYTIWMSQAQYPRDWIANGWAYSTNRWPGSYSSASAILPCNGGSLANTQLGPFVWTDLKLSSHAFPVIVQAGDCPGQILSGDAYALDGSGYHLFIRYVRNPGVPTGSIANWAVTVYDKEGNVEYHTFTSNSTIENRTAISSNGNGLGSTSPSTYPCYSNLDTLARSIFVGCNYQLAPINVTWNNQFHVFSLPTSKNVSGNFSLYPTWLPTTTASTTNFHQSGVQESNLNVVTILPSLTIQDGSTYTFTYDCDSNLGSPCGSPSGLAGYTGQLIKITWPTGATVSFTYQNFTDANGHTNSWVK